MSLRHIIEILNKLVAINIRYQVTIKEVDMNYNIFSGKDSRLCRWFLFFCLFCKFWLMCFFTYLKYM